MGNAFCCHELYDEEELQRRHPSIALVTKRFETLETPAPAIPGILPTSPTPKEWDFCHDATEKECTKEGNMPVEEKNIEAI